MSNLDALPFAAFSAHFRGGHFRNPTLLASTPMPPQKFLLVGPCTLERIVGNPQAQVELVLFHGGLIPELPSPVATYDAVICGTTLRNLMSDDALWSLPFLQEKDFEAIFRKTKRELEAHLQKLLTITAGTEVPVFFMNFMVPTLNPNGRLMSNDSFGNIRYFLTELNRSLELACRDAHNAHYVDLDAILNTYGKMFFTDEIMCWYSHNSFFSFYHDGQDGSRLEATPHTVEHFHLIDLKVISDAFLNEVTSQLRILRGVDAVKLIVLDLDDTLWRGVIGDQPFSLDELKPKALNHMVEGWPLGILEALMYCKKRGILLAILSKNSEATVRQVFPAIFGSTLALQDFAVVKINFADKDQGMAEILAATNLLPGNVLYIDDNPVERERIATAFPDIRVIGKYFQYTRHLLLNAPETQTARVTAEAAVRTQMVQGQVQRNDLASQLEPEAFLSALNLEANLFEITDLDGNPKTGRIIDLINKTNQWNSTGEPTNLEQLLQNQARGERLFGVSAQDKFAQYGDVCFLRIQDQELKQFVMSCRVAGLRLEQAIFERLFQVLQAPELLVRFMATPKNKPFAQFVARLPEGPGQSHRFGPAQVQGLTHVAFQ